jgi:hypothetical protein
VRVRTLTETHKVHDNSTYMVGVTHFHHISNGTKSHNSSGETSHSTSSLKGLMLYDKRHYSLTQRSLPWWSHPMLYGCEYFFFDKYNYLMTSTEMMLFWLLLSTIKCSGVRFTDICEWKRRPPLLRILWFF